MKISSNFAHEVFSLRSSEQTDFFLCVAVYAHTSSAPSSTKHCFTRTPRPQLLYAFRTPAVQITPAKSLQSICLYGVLLWFIFLYWRWVCAIGLGFFFFQGIKSQRHVKEKSRPWALGFGSRFQVSKKKSKQPKQKKNEKEGKTAFNQCTAVVMYQ